MKVTFSGGNGNCPSFTHKNTRFLIMDYLDVDKWTYCVAKQDLTEEKIIFNTHKEAMKYIANEYGFGEYYFKCRDKENKKLLFADNDKDYIINKNILTIKNKPARLTLDFDNYYDCLKKAKQIAEDYIKKVVPEQLVINIVD